MCNAFKKAEAVAAAPKPRAPEPVRWCFPAYSPEASALHRYLETDRALKAAETRRDEAKERIEKILGDKYVSLCAATGEKPGAVTASAGIETVAFAVQERATALDHDALDRLREAAGDDLYTAPLIDSAVSLKFNPDVLAERTADGSMTVYEWLGNRLDVSLRRAVSEGTITEAQRSKLIQAERKTVAAKGWISRVVSVFKGRPDKIREFFGVLAPSAFAKA